MHELLGQGTFGAVFRATPKGGGESVAVKVMLSVKRLDDAEKQARSEVYALSRLSSDTPLFVQRDTDRHTWQDAPPGCAPEIVCMRDYFHGQGQESPFYIVLRYVNGPTLEELAREFPAAQQSRFPPEFILYFLWRTARTLEYMHARGILHNDLKPGNIAWDDNAQESVLFDFGLSCTTGVGGKQLTDRCMSTGGTPDYTAPEMWLYKFLRHQKSDVWSLGIIVWELLTGNEYRAPGQDLQEIAQAVSQGARPRLEHIPEGNFWRTLLEGMLAPARLADNFDDRAAPRDILNFLRTMDPRYATMSDDKVEEELREPAIAALYALREAGAMEEAEQAQSPRETD